jgi:gamma-glutamyltranspeptidase/glutathione hydrolase
MPETRLFASAAAAAPHALAARAGRDILAQGGNAVEAMLAMAATIAVVYPHMNGIGGDGFWLVREPGGRVHAIEAAGFAGEKATIARFREMGYDALPKRGPHAAVTVPGAIGGWIAAQALAKSLGGRLPLADLVADAVRHARDGYPISQSEARYQPKELAALKEAPGFGETFHVEGKVPPAGTPRKAEALGATLDHLARAGLSDFYRGDIARELAADMERIGVPVTRADLARFSTNLRQPLCLKVKGATLYNFPPPTQGLASLLLLGMFERLEVRERDGFAHMHALIEAAKRAMAIRDHVVTDFERMSHNPADFLTPARLDREAARIDMARAAPFPLRYSDGDTIWMGAIDGDGVAVSYIQSLFWEYGSGCVLPKTGILLQNRGTAFSLDPSAKNPLEPGRRPFHTLNPALAVMDDGRVVSYGAMGGDGQPQFQAQVFTRWRMGASVADALDAPRFLLGKTWGEDSASLKVENRFDPDVLEALRRAGHPVEVRKEAYHDSLGHAGLLVKSPRNGSVEAGHDPRSDGSAEGL